MSNTREYLPVTGEWVRVLGPMTKDVTLYGEDGLVDVFVSPISDFDTTLISLADVATIGGLSAQTDCLIGQYLYIRTRSAGETKCYYLNQGQIDPSQDVTALAQLLQATIDDLQSHRGVSNAHAVTKAIVGLGNIPNAITSDPTTTADDILTTGACLHAVKTALQNEDSRVDNPHVVTKGQIGLGDVVNYGVVADLPTATDSTITDKLATVNQIHHIVSTREARRADITPNTIISAAYSWTNEDDKGLVSPSYTTVQLSGEMIQIPSGLQVAYSDNGVTKISDSLTTMQEFTHATLSEAMNPHPGYHYIYVDINELNVITNVGHTQDRPIYGPVRYSDTCDYFSTVTNRMYDTNDLPICRVYIGKVHMADDFTPTCIPVPVGDVYIRNVDQAAIPDQTYLFENVFMEDVVVTPRLHIGDQRCDPKWNDQIGVKAIYNPYVKEKITVQTGKLGIATSGNTAGNDFTPENVSGTVTTGTAMSLEIRRA